MITGEPVKPAVTLPFSPDRPTCAAATKRGRKFRGALLGALIGDSLGVAVDGWETTRVAEMLDLCAFLPADSRYRAIYQSALGPLAGGPAPGMTRCTALSRQMTAAAESLVVMGGFHGPHAAQRLLDTHEANRLCCDPDGCAAIIALRRGVPWQIAATTLCGGAGSAGLGAAARVVPAALLYHDVDPGCRRRIADMAASITHAHPLGREGAVLQSAAVALACRLDPADTLDPFAFLAAIRSELCGGGSVTYLAALEAVATLLRARPAPPAREIAALLGNGPAAARAVPAALYAFLSGPCDFRATIVRAVRLGGCASGIGALAGALSGAYLGESALPSCWLDVLENGTTIGRDTARHLADGLVTASYGPDRERLLPK